MKNKRFFIAFLHSVGVTYKEHKEKLNTVLKEILTQSKEYEKLNRDKS